MKGAFLMMRAGIVLHPNESLIKSPNGVAVIPSLMHSVVLEAMPLRLRKPVAEVSYSPIH